MKKLLIVGCSLLLFLFANITFAQTPPSGGNGGGSVGGIECNADQLRNGQCKFNIYQSLGIKQSSSEDPTSVGLFLQDIVLSMTFFIGTLVTIVIIYAGIMFIRSGIKGDDALQATAKKGIMGGLIGSCLLCDRMSLLGLYSILYVGDSNFFIRKNNRGKSI